ncbi:MAG: hypothetical protein M1816_002676 [Peltula sp. TS41687]|nr:MAG: hypothetical protein M1816_002676 [Peltula sp. TS41687]
MAFCEILQAQSDAAKAVEEACAKGSLFPQFSQTISDTSAGNSARCPDCHFTLQSESQCEQCVYGPVSEAFAAWLSPDPDEGDVADSARMPSQESERLQNHGPDEGDIAHSACVPSLELDRLQNPLNNVRHLHPVHVPSADVSNSANEPLATHDFAPARA